RVCVDAGAGTGKTKTLVEVLAEVILRESDKKNPLERILVVTFGVEASRKIKNDLKERLLDHELGGGKIPKDVMRYIETESSISTIDSLLNSMFKEIAPVLGISPSFEIANYFQSEEILEDVISELRENPDVKEDLEYLETLYSGFFRKDYAEYETMSEVLRHTQQKMREFCLLPEERDNVIREAVKNVLYLGKKPPLSRKDVEDIINAATNGKYRLECENKDERKMLDYVESVYKELEDIYSRFAKVLRRFDEVYDGICKKKCLFSYVDIAYMIWKYSISDEKHALAWKDSLRGKYDHVLIDEFQDTSYVQFEILKLFIRKEPPNRVMLIGDVKQSIYQWRGAEPEIFAKMITKLKKGKRLELNLDGMEYHALRSNFRTHKDLIYFFNSVFSHMFSDKSTGAIYDEVPYNALEPMKKTNSNENEFDKLPRLHMLKIEDNLNGGYVRNNEAWIELESSAIASCVDGLIKQGVKEGDIALIFRRKKHIPMYARKLRERGINCILLADNSIFIEPEVSLLIDFLDWLGNPESRESITRILRSPLVAISDETLRFLSMKKYAITVALKEWDGSLPESDKTRLEDLLGLRDDLRWDREGSKIELVQKIISHTAFDSVVLASNDGVQAYANLWLFQEIVSAWEEEELMPYREFIEELKAYRDLARKGKEKEYPRAKLAAEQSKNAVRITTVHMAKGLEYPIVILADAIMECDDRHNRILVVDRSVGAMLSPMVKGKQPAEMKITKTKNKGESDEIKWADGYSRSVIWGMYERENDGKVPNPTMFQKVMLKSVAEYWRILYVALTRAKEHLIIPYGTISKKDKEYANWLNYLRMHLSKVDSKNGILNLEWLEWDEKVGSQVVKRKEVIKVNDKLSKPPLSNQQKIVELGNIKGLGSESEFKVAYEQFVPKRLTPSTFSEIIDCPRRYQYGVLWKMDGVRSLAISRKEDDNSDDIFDDDFEFVDEFGSLVHKALEHRDFTKELRDDLNDNSGLGKWLSVRKPNSIEEVKKALEGLEKLEIGKKIREAAKAGRPIRREEKVYRLISDPNKRHPAIILSGRFDLLFLDENGEWIIVDFKTESKKEEGSYRDEHYKTQIGAYCWALKDKENITITKGCIAYLYPNEGETVFSINIDGFDEKIKKIWDIKLEKNGLIANPSAGKNGRCVTCPYRKSNKGPCEYG
ncbi:MAG: UvrD-helicase domain-containing protein, partial [Thermoplasmata archaeon]